MNRQDTLKFLALVKVAYPSAYKDADKDTLLATVKMWQSTFADLPYPIMEAAFDNFRRHSKFPPTVAEIYSEIKRIHSIAWQDLNDAALEGDDQKLCLAASVMEITEPYAIKKRRAAIPYDAVSNLLIAKNNAALLSSPHEE